MKNKYAKPILLNDALAYEDVMTASATFGSADPQESPDKYDDAYRAAAIFDLL